MLRYRLITGPLLILALLAIVVLDNWLDTVRLSEPWQELFRGRQHPPRGLIMYGLSLVIAVLAAIELTAIMRAQHIRAEGWLTAVAAAVGLTASYGIPYGTPTGVAIAIVATSLVLVFVVSLLVFSRNRNVMGVMAASGSVMFAMVYLGLMLGFLLLLRREHSAWWIVGIVLTTKACDTAAYFTGRAIGRHKLIPWLSPGKTWEGLAGGVLGSAVAGIIFAALNNNLLESEPQLQWLPAAVCGGIFGLVGQAGDLTMSLLKRGAGVKDSSQLLPGMGGVLDVMDSPLMVAPVAYWLLTIVFVWT